MRARRSAQLRTGLHFFFYNNRALTVSGHTPDPVTDMPPAFFSGFFGDVLRMGNGMFSAVKLKVHIISVFLPEASDRLKVIAGGVQDQMMVEQAI